MKEKLINNPGLKVLSILLAFFVWLLVVNVSNPEVNRSKEVKLEIENERVLAAANQTYELDGKDSVTITYDVRTRDEYKIRASDFRAYIDLAELYDVTGSVPVKVEVLNNKELLSNVTAKAGTVRVNTEPLQRKRFDLEVIRNNEPEDGYEVNEIILKPNYVYVSGPVSEVGKISKIAAVIELGGLESDITSVVTPMFYDANDNELPQSSRVTMNHTQIDYTVTIHRVKSLNLDFEVSGTVANGYRFVGAEGDIKMVSVQGLKTTLASLTKITIPASVLSVEGATADRRVTVDLQEYLPEGVVIVGSSGIAEVLLKVERLETRRFVLEPETILWNGQNDMYQYVLIPERIELTVQGLGEDLDSLILADLGAAIDVTGFEPGQTYPVDLVFNQSEVFEVVSYTETHIITALEGEDIDTETTVDGGDDTEAAGDEGAEASGEVSAAQNETTASAESPADES